MIELSNEQLTIKVAEMGAELQSIIDDEGREYLWQADPNYWPRHSPILFPIVCSVENDTYTVDGKEYHLPRHGFARDTAFTLVAQSEKKVVFALHENEETLKVYPFRFNLAVSYRLDGNKIHVVWHVENTDKREMHFQIGGHPAFYAPGCEAGKPLKGVLRVDNPNQLQALKSHIDGSVEMEEVEIASQDGLIVFDDEFFANDSVKLHKSQTSSVELLNPDGSVAVTLSYKCPIIAFWSPYQKNAPFVCLEPWYGVGDPRGYKGEFKDKPFTNHLQPGASFMSEYVITIG
jgi:galactose mutarotase-like enzyme